MVQKLQCHKYIQRESGSEVSVISTYRESGSEVPVLVGKYREWFRSNVSNYIFILINCCGVSPGALKKIDIRNGGF